MQKKSRTGKRNERRKSFWLLDCLCPALEGRNRDFGSICLPLQTQEKQETGYRRWFWNVWTDGRKSMNKYDMMIACNRKTSEEKINRAVTEIRQMLTDREKVTVPKLVKRTGLSRGFFYKNETVRKEMDRVLEQQAGMIDPKRYIGDIVMKNRIELLEQQVRELKREKEQLEKENIRLQKALNKKDLNLLKNL